MAHTPLKQGFAPGPLIVRLVEAIVLIVALLISLQHYTTPLQAQIDELKQTTEATAADAWDLYQRALFLQQDADPQGALALLNYALEIAPAPFAQGLGLRGMLYADLNRNDDALVDLQQAVALNPNALEWQATLCQMKAERRNFAAAEQHCAIAVQLAPDDFSLVNTLCFVRSYNDRLPEAINDCTSAINLAADHPYPWSNRAHAHLELGNYAAAIQDATRSIQLGNDYPQMPHTVRGRAYMAQNRFDEALSDFQIALESDTAYPDVYAGLGEWYDLQGALASARDYYCGYLTLAWTTPTAQVQQRVAQLGGCPV